MAYVLWQIDQDTYRTSSVELTVLRLTRETEWIASTKHQGDETRTENLRRMIAMMLDPEFTNKPFPPPEQTK